MELKKPVYNDYSKQEMDKYKGKLATALLEEGVSTDYTFKNPEAQNYIANWAKEHIIDKEMHYKLQGFTFRFANLNLGVRNNDNSESEIRTFPVINKYKGHNIVETIYFALDKDGAILDKTILVKDKIITLN